jgi:hypothetical protein
LTEDKSGTLIKATGVMNKELPIAIILIIGLLVSCAIAQSNTKNDCPYTPEDYEYWQEAPTEQYP